MNQQQQQQDMQQMSGAREIEALFVQSAEGMVYDDGRLQLGPLAPTTLFFSDRPDRITGHLTSKEFVDSWGAGENSFASDPPNAVLSILDPEEVRDIVVVLRDPHLEGDRISYDIDVLDGEIPAHGGPSALFIDVIGRPLSPISFAGMHRRDRRAARRMSRI